MRLLTLVAMLVLPSSALRLPPPATSRRSAVAAGASLVPALVMPTAAWADAIEDIAARSNAQAKETAAAKEKAAADKKVRA